jgi:hypothetical protein
MEDMKHDDQTIEKKPLPKTMKLSARATRELVEVLKQDIGEEVLSKLSDEEINHIGVLMLTLTSIQLKIRIREKKLEKDFN